MRREKVAPCRLSEDVYVFSSYDETVRPLRQNEQRAAYLNHLITRSNERGDCGVSEY